MNRDHQTGLAGALIIIVILLSVIAVMFGSRFVGPGESLGQRKDTAVTMKQISDALANYLSEMGRLPCPAAGNSTTGRAEPDAATTTCATTAIGGVVPWATLSLRPEDILDTWGRRISYRVYSGSNGFTQSDGLSMAKCNINPSTTASPSLPFQFDPISGTCLMGPQTVGGVAYNLDYSSPGDIAGFLAGKGLVGKDDSSNTLTSIAFALISHGPTGAGAYLPNLLRMATPPAPAPPSTILPSEWGREFENTKDGISFVGAVGMGAESPSTVLANQWEHFDDLVLLVRADDMLRSVGLVARDWGDVSTKIAAYSSASALSAATVSAQSMSRSSLASVLGSTPSYNTGLNTVDFGAFTVTAYGSTARNVSSGIGTSGEGIGSIGTGTYTSSASTLNSATNESLAFQFTRNDLRYMGITLVDFGILGGFSGTERVRFRFYRGGTQVAQIDKSACSATNFGNVRANFLLDPVTTFDEIVVAPRSTTTGSNSTLLVGGLRACTDLLGSNSCTASGAVPTDNCP